MERLTYKGKVEELKPDQIFVFGSNPVGIQGGGSALFAVKKGWCLPYEKMDNCLSKSGKSWGLVTISYPGKKKSKSPDEIKLNIKKLYDFALNNPDKEFLIAYTGIDNYNRNGYSNNELAKMFASIEIPNNIVFEEDFCSLISPKGEKGFFI